MFGRREVPVFMFTGFLDGGKTSFIKETLKEGLDYYFPKQKRVFVYTSLKNKDFSTIQKNLFQKKYTFLQIFIHFHKKLRGNMCAGDTI